MMQGQIPPVSLIHIGLPKTATTYLQTAWSLDPGVCLVQNGLLPLINDARQRGKELINTNFTPSAAPINFDSQPQHGQKLVFSNEALSSAYLNERASAAQIRTFQELAAARMKSTVAKSKILLVTRSPEKLILSIYNQAVKQGGTDTFRQFVRRERDFIEQALNIRELFNIWKPHYGSGNILILPMELLRDDEPRFYKEIEKFSGVPQPRVKAPDSVNTSLQDGHLEVMRQFNKWVQLFSEHGKHGGKLPANIQQALTALRFDVRYALETPTPALDRRLKLLERNMRQPPVDPADLPRDLLKAIRAGNAKQLKKDDFFGYRKLYV